MIPIELYYTTPYYTLMLAIMIMVLGLSTFWISIYFANKKRIHNKDENITFFPDVSIIVPAYNEEKNIKNVLEKIISFDYPKDKIEILVIDDGSTDNTASIAKGFPVKLINYGKNMGKIYALNTGIEKAKNNIIITIDADTEPKKDFLKRIVQPLKEDGVGAVSGIYKAKRHKSKNPLKFLLEKLQAVEYLGFCLLRKQQEMLESVIVVPGSVAAYRKSALEKVGKFTDDTIIEDYEITMRMHKAGYKVRCVKDALADVIAPRTLGALVRERTRWYRGGIQVLKKHHDIFFTRLGIVTYIWAMDALGMLMQLIVFGLAMSMIINQIMIHSLSGFMSNWVVWMTNIAQLRFGLFDVLLLLSIFIAVLGIVNMGIAISLSKDRKRKMLLYPLMLFYNSFLFIVFLKSLIQELIGAKSEWVKAEM